MEPVCPVCRQRASQQVLYVEELVSSGDNEIRYAYRQVCDGCAAEYTLEVMPLVVVAPTDVLTEEGSNEFRR